MGEKAEKKDKKDKSDKKEKRKEADTPQDDGADADDVKRARVSVIANPLASKRLTKSLLKVIQKASAAKLVRRGVKEVVKALKKDEKGLCIIAGDISPIDVICHIPIYCEEKQVPYIYVPSKEELGAASQTKRPTSIVMIKAGSDAELKSLIDECVSEVKKAMPKF
ncbi:50S ribosomal protein L30e-like protein [Pavlovales sp. CCMP2436]|nr:50S ribosomal protein L30e-like protein [Pavlovales sp. CCMP2436]|mmetsp:Transcript_2132/g.5750  ORF Transcript_2132/g.5750 Transcript_2132/m.5750 type:complete len:166 (-) Transcript_2132:315-812(-)